MPFFKSPETRTLKVEIAIQFLLYQKCYFERNIIEKNKAINALGLTLSRILSLSLGSPERNPFSLSLAMMYIIRKTNRGSSLKLLNQYKYRRKDSRNEEKKELFKNFEKKKKTNIISINSFGHSWQSVSRRRTVKLNGIISMYHYRSVDNIHGGLCKI